MKQPDKDHIESALQHSNMNLAETLLQDLRLIYPHDRDFYFYQCIYFLTIKQYEQAQNIITDCLRKFPTSYECGLSTLFQTNFFRLFFRYCTGV